MALRRMFSKSITNSSQFLMMPQSAQNLYFHLGMNADDDGFCEHFTIMRMTDSKPDDLKILQAKGYIHVFDDRVLVIADWKENNYLRSDRYTPSKYLTIYEKELKCLPSGIPVVVKRDTQDRIGKDRKGKKGVPVPPNSLDEVLKYIADNNLNVDGPSWYNFFVAGNWYDSKGSPVLSWKQKLQTYHRHGWMPAPQKPKSIYKDL